MMPYKKLVLICLVLVCHFLHAQNIPVVFDTDANNEVDDQQALAYLLFNPKTFNVKGVTVNATNNGSDIDAHYNEALRILKLCARDKTMPLYRGANKNFRDIETFVTKQAFDGSDAVNFIIQQANRKFNQKLVVIAVGKLTNLALAIKKDPGIISKIKIVWLGSNYPEPGEYNMVNDTASMNYVLQTNVEFQLSPAVYGKTTGTDYVKVTKHVIDSIMPGLGPKVSPVEGRHGGTFTCFGDYAQNLFEHIEYYGDPPSRALFDMAAVAVVKNASFAQHTIIPCPVLKNGVWIEQPANKRKITLWKNFDRQAILKDFFTTLQQAK
jgi:hypothetical protein